MAVIPQIHEEDNDQIEHDVVHHGDVVSHYGHDKESRGRDQGQISAKTVNTVGSVGEVDGTPYEKRCQENVERLRDIDRLMNDVDINGKREQERSKCSGSHRDDHVGQSFKCSGPWLSVIQVTTDHGH